MEVLAVDNMTNAAGMYRILCVFMLTQTLKSTRSSYISETELAFLKERQSAGLGEIVDGEWRTKQTKKQT